MVANEDSKKNRFVYSTRYCGYYRKKIVLDLRDPHSDIRKSYVVIIANYITSKVKTLPVI